jgi:phage host-nuclease inhibitor protein Gam
MAVATFGTLKFANALKAAGVPDKQAEAEATVLSEALQLNLKELATKDDLASTKGDLKREIDDFRKEVKQDIDSFRKEVNQEIDSFRKEVKQEFKDLEQRTNAKIDEVRNEIKNSEQRVTARMDVMDATSRALRVELKGDMFLLKWMFGVAMTAFVGLLIRLLFYRSPI